MTTLSLLEASGKPRNDHSDAAWITRQLDDACGYLPVTGCCSCVPRSRCTREVVYPGGGTTRARTTLSYTLPCPTPALLPGILASMLCTRWWCTRAGLS